MAYNNRRNRGNQTPGGPNGQQRGRFDRLNQGGMQTRPGVGGPNSGMSNMNQGPNSQTGRASGGGMQTRPGIPNAGIENRGGSRRMRTLPQGNVVNPQTGRASQNSNTMPGSPGMGNQTRPGTIPGTGNMNQGPNQGTGRASQNNNTMPNSPRPGMNPSPMAPAPNVRSYDGGIRANTGDYYNQNSNPNKPPANQKPMGRNYQNNDYNEGY